MTFPAVQSRASGTSGASALTSHPITLPAGIVAGDSLLVAFSVDRENTCSTASTDWVKLGQASYTSLGTPQDTQAIFYKASATGSDALTITTPSADESTHVSLRISGAQGPFTGSSSISTSSSVNSDPPSHNAGSAQDYLWVVTRLGATTVATAPPTGYSNLQTQANGSSLPSVNTAERQLNAAIQDPGTFTSPSGGWVCWTIAVPPAAGITQRMVRVNQAVSRAYIY